MSSMLAWLSTKLSPESVITEEEKIRAIRVLSDSDDWIRRRPFKYDAPEDLERRESQMQYHRQSAIDFWEEERLFRRTIVAKERENLLQLHGEIERHSVITQIRIRLPPEIRDMVYGYIATEHHVSFGEDYFKQCPRSYLYSVARIADSTFEYPWFRFGNLGLEVEKELAEDLFRTAVFDFSPLSSSYNIPSILRNSTTGD
ncbi:hypothetical protein BDV96DRAFT_607897 [Lophiotrema nucula]|uniref:Uncharacterized protein n=1 Tax=Lophiotrema nucula TaxID=690887 RepID=A0A6A5YF09_9PLEO|nr:hypothetical protein BDV96DRAFT_607897 [Lophiotrema nucula]